MYGLAIYCPSCGQLAPAQQLVELVRVQRDRLAALNGLDAQRRRDLVEAGVVTSIYESTFKDGFGALETYLKDRFLQEPAVGNRATGRGGACKPADLDVGRCHHVLEVTAFRDLEDGLPAHVGRKAFEDCADGRDGRLIAGQQYALGEAGPPFDAAGHELRAGDNDLGGR